MTEAVETTEEAVAETSSAGDFWPDETVDAIAACVVFCALTAFALWFVFNG